jgi:hypothetical protein
MAIGRIALLETLGQAMVTPGGSSEVYQSASLFI